MEEDTDMPNAPLEPVATPAAVNTEDTEDSSDVELEGMDVDDSTPHDSTVEDTAMIVDAEDEVLHNESDTHNNDNPHDHVNTEVDDREAQELEEARKERQELMAAEQKKIAQQQRTQGPATAQERLDYILAQSDVFAHFLAGLYSTSSHAFNGLVVVY
jgi:hypothetical protein